MSLDGIDTVDIALIGPSDLKILMIIHQNIIENKSFNKSCLPIWITEKRAKWEWPSVSWLGPGLPQLWGRRHHQLSIPPSMITIASIPLFDLELIAPPATTVPPWSHLATIGASGLPSCPSSDGFRLNQGAIINLIERYVFRLGNLLNIVEKVTGIN